MKWSWLGALLCTMGVCTYLSYRLVSADKRVYLPGDTSYGHYQIELKCEACHMRRGEVKSDACLSCHAAELQAADDSHPPSKFLDPRNAALIAKLDARSCGTCHIEHRPMLTNSMGVTLPGDYCFYCHEDVADERPSHAGLDHESCQSAGCHNFHDNRGLHEDFLELHLGEPALLPSARLPPVHHAIRAQKLTAHDIDVPLELPRPDIVDAWEKSAHARGNVHCSACHGGQPGTFVAFATEEVCVECHKIQVEGFRAGHHGMRLSAGLPPLRTEDARLPMTVASQGREIGCHSCHGAHAYDLKEAAVDRCLGCHADQHSLAYRGSPHAQSFEAERGGAAPGSGVACASCHLPRVPAHPGAPEHFIQHNQNDNLRPNEKMVRTVCIHCHGVGFSLDALADESLVRSNFRGTPIRHVRSIDWVAKRRPEQGTAMGK